MGNLGPVIFILLQALQVIVAPIPGEVTGVLGGFLFGEWYGLLYSLVAQAAGVSSPGLRIIFSTSAMCCSSSLICSRAYSSSQTLLSRTRSSSS